MPPPAGCLPFHRNRACPIRREANVRAHQVSCPAPGRRRLRPCPGHLAASWPADRGPQPAAGHAGRGWGDRSTWRRSRRGESPRRRRLCADQVPDSRHDLGGLAEICTTEGVPGSRPARTAAPRTRRRRRGAAEAGGVAVPPPVPLPPVLLQDAALKTIRVIPAPADRQARRPACAARPPFFPDTSVAVRSEWLSKRYGCMRALDRLSLEVRPGEVPGFLGPKRSPGCAVRPGPLAAAAAVTAAPAQTSAGAGAGDGEPFHRGDVPAGGGRDRDHLAGRGEERHTGRPRAAGAAGRPAAVSARRDLR